MATDVRAVIENLRSFHDLAGRAVLSVGAGGGQFVDLYAAARAVVAVDSDPAALRQLQAAVDARGLRDRYELVEGDFFEVDRPVDVVVFEFCLHEMPDPAKALARARALRDKVASQGPLALERIAPFRDKRDIVVPMSYLAALL